MLTRSDFMKKLAMRDLWRIPGLLSLSRVPLAAVFAAVSAKPLPAIAVLTLAAATDLADGWYARQFHQETPTGRVLDPITDKLFVGGVIASLLASRSLTVGEALLLGTRELGELALLLVVLAVRQHRPRPIRGANRWGKLATLMQFVSVAAILLETPYRQLWVLSTAACGIFATLSYARREWPGRDHASSEPPAWSL
jgi:phosphatidylglycerophosphate synthase